MTCDERFLDHRYAPGFARTLGIGGRRSSRLVFVITTVLSVIALLFAFPHQKTASQTSYLVLVGDSITANWWSLTQAKDILGMRVANRGRSGDFTDQMLTRFEQDVIQLHPRVVVILGGTNDILRGTSAAEIKPIERNLETMANLADKNGIRVVMATLPPNGGIDSVNAPSPRALSDRNKIKTLNDWIRAFAHRKDYGLADYYGVLADDRGYYLKDASTDGIHPSARGYALMEPTVREAVQAAIHKSK